MTSTLAPPDEPRVSLGVQELKPRALLISVYRPKVTMAPPKRLAFLATLAFALLGVTASSYCQQKKPASKLVTAPGVKYSLLLDGLSDPRGLVADTEDNVLMVERGDGGKGVMRVVLDDGYGEHVCVESKQQLIADSKVRVRSLKGVESSLHLTTHASSTTALLYPKMARHSLRRRQTSMPGSTMPSGAQSATGGTSSRA